MTQKQILAIENLIADSEYIIRARVRDGAKRCRELVGEIVTENGVFVSNGCMAIRYPVPAGLRRPEEPDMEFASRLQDKLESVLASDLHMVTLPEKFSPANRIGTRIREVLKQYSMPPQSRLGRIDLTANPEFREMWNPLEGRYDSLYVRNAVEAVGKDAAAYLGNPERSGIPPYLLVAPWRSGKLLTDDVVAIVLPIRKD